MPEKDHRQHHRVPYFGPARISWHDEEGTARFGPAKFLNVSAEGVRIEVAETIPVGSHISLRAERISLSGSATVRNISWRSCKYILGLNLSQTQSAEFLAMIGVA